MTDDSDFRVLFVCTGNTCRSPMAEGIAQKLMMEKAVDNIKISSAGTSAVNGLPPTEFAVQAAHRWDIDISAHRSIRLSRAMVEQADLLLAMGHEHVANILSLEQNAKSKTYLLKGFPQTYNHTQEIVDDPIGGSLEQYNQTFLELDEIIRKTFPWIIELSKLKG